METRREKMATMTQIPKRDARNPRVQEVVDRVTVLREYTRQTGFKTTKSQNDLLQTLDGKDLAEALLALR
jgi:hypothetical protein